MYSQTPLLVYPQGSVTFYLKMECWQPTGSFKLRGMSHIARIFQEQGKAGLVSSSGGNAGYSLAYAGQRLGIPVQVIVPESTPEPVRERISSLGARVQVHGKAWDDANTLALQLSESEDLAYVSPFDQPEIWAGHASLIDECAGKMPRPDAVVLSVGGGGLLCGVLEGMHRQGWQDIPLWAAETSGAASYAAAMAAGRPVEIAGIHSVAKSLGARKVAEEAFAWTRRHPIQSYIMEDTEALKACHAFARSHRSLVEPACGAALSVMYAEEALFEPGQHILIVVCGGIDVSWMDA